MFIDALKNFFDWNGRICRRQFLFLFILSVVVGTLLIGMTGGKSGNGVMFVLSLLLIPSYMKRLHDIGWSGGLIFLSLIPFVGMILFFLMLVVGGTHGSNKYGPDPRAPKISSSSNDDDENDEPASTPSGDKWQTLGDGLAEFILLITGQDKSLSSLQEKLEMCYLLLIETDHLIFVNFRGHRERISDRMLGQVLLKSSANKEMFEKAVDEYHARIPVYMACKELISKSGATIGTRAFALSHFLQKARGKASGKDMTDVITGKKELAVEDMGEFLDFFESMTLVMSLSQALISIKRIMDKFKEL